MNYIIIENEPIARETMIEMCRDIRPGWNLIATLEGISDTLEFLSDNIDRVDLALFDIELVDGNCFEIFRQTEVNFPVIFTTAYEEYILRAFKVNSLDYILKPITMSALRTAFDKYDRLYGETAEKFDSTIYKQLLESINGQRPKQLCTRILTNSGDKYGYVNINDVAYFISEDKYSFAVTFDGRKLFTTYLSLTDIENDIDETHFFRLSRSIITNIDAIESVSKYFGGRLMVTLKTAEQSERIMVSSARRKQFLKWLGSGAGGSQ